MNFYSGYNNEGKSRKNLNRGSYIAVQPTALSRRKKNIIGRRSHPEGRPRFRKQNERNIEAIEIIDMANTPSHKQWCHFLRGQHSKPSIGEI